ncbi:hypothetical protein PMAYCL1PPCAC_03673, partial [Pristionchus mayeri]
MSMRTLGRSSAKRGLAPALRKEHDVLKIVLVTLYRGVAFEDIMTKYTSLTEPFFAPSLAKVIYPVVTYFAFHIFLFYMCSLAIFKEIYEKTVFGRYVAGWVGRLADQYNAWQGSRLPRIIPPPIRVQIDEGPKLQPASPKPGTDHTAAAAASAAAEASGKSCGLRSSPNSSPQKRGAETSESLSSLASSNPGPSDSAATSASLSSEGGGASSSLSSITTTTASSSDVDEDEDDEKDAVPFPFTADPAPRSSPRTSRESTDESRASSASSGSSVLAASTPDFATPPQSPMP